MHRYYGQRNVSEAANDLVLCSAECSSSTLIWTPLKVRASDVFTWGNLLQGDSDVSLLTDSETPCDRHPRADPLFPFLFTMWRFSLKLASCSWPVFLANSGHLKIRKECPEGLWVLSLYHSLLHVHFQFNDKKNILNQNLPDTLLKYIFRIYFAQLLYIFYIMTES